MPFSYDRVRRELLDEQGKLHEQLERLTATEYESIGYSNHIADDATDAFEQTVGVALRRKLEATLEDVGRALGKFQDGTYGLCEVCGGRIERARLEALPHARCCLGCQSRQEHSTGRTGCR